MTASQSPLSSTGPLSGVRLVELAGIGPTPYATLIFAELGADVIRVERPREDPLFRVAPPADLLNRGKRSIALDLKREEDRELALELVATADIVVEGYRPGVAERLGVGPDECLLRNPRLVYGRMTGWGQDGPLAGRAGHDINYIAITGALHAIGTQGGAPVVPLNLVGDFGGGSLFLVIGLLAALRHASLTGRGQVVDAAIVDGTVHLLSGIHSLLADGQWRDERGVNAYDGGSGYYGVFETSDGEYLAVGAIEPQFFRELLLGLELDVDTPQHDNRQLKDIVAKAIRSRSLTDWLEVFAGGDACVAPVMSLRGAANHPHIRARAALVERDGVLQASPAPRFSRTPTALPQPAPEAGQHTHELVEELRQRKVYHAL